MSLPLFLVLGGLTVLASLGVILQRSPVRSALSLVGVLFLLAVIYVFLDAHLVAALQIIVYAGAIMVLFLFVIMLLNLTDDPPVLQKRSALRVGAAIASALLVVELIHFFRGAPGDVGGGSLPPEFGTVEAVAERLFTHFSLAFEATSILLLVAIVGAVVLAKRKIS